MRNIPMTVDEYRLMIFPTILGTGKRFFGETSDAAALRLVDAKPAGETFIFHLRAKRKGCRECLRTANS